MTTGRASRLALGAAPVVALVAVWAAWVGFGDVDAIIAPSPMLVVTDLTRNAGTYVAAVLDTTRTITLGLAVGTGTGALLAVAAWWSTPLGAMIRPTAAVMRAVPLVALIPIVSRVVGYGTTSTAIITALISFFPTYVLVGSGLRDLPAGAWSVLAALGANRRDALLRAAIPAAVPNLGVALQLTAPLAVLGCVAAEYLTGTGGLGELFAKARFDYGNPARGWGVAVCTTALSALAYSGATHLRRLAQWRFR